MRVRLTDIAHFVFGVWLAVIGVMLPVHALILSLLYVAYQYTEYVRVHNVPHRDILEMMAGFIVGTVGVMGWNVGG